MDEHFIPCGLGELGVFYDYCSLYQHYPVERTTDQEACFRRALQNMSMWFAHMATYVFLFNSDAATPSHEERGWCSYERAMSRLCKDNSHAGDPYLLDLGFPAVLPYKVTELGTDVPPRPGPPLAPEVFGEILSKLNFTNNTDFTLVQQLYTSAIVELYASTPFLDFDRCTWTDNDALALAATLRACPCPCLTELSLQGNQITDAGVEALCLALHGGGNGSPCPRLTRLSLASNQCGPAGVRALADMLCTGAVPHLAHLRLGRNQIGAEGAVSLATGLVESKTPLCALSLHNNALGAEGVRALAAAFECLPTLDEVVLGHNSAGDEGALALADALRGRKLARIDFRDNGLNPDAVAALSAAVEGVRLEDTPRAPAVRRSVSWDPETAGPDAPTLLPTRHAGQSALQAEIAAAVAEAAALTNSATMLTAK